MKVEFFVGEKEEYMNVGYSCDVIKEGKEGME
jgi:hypothetical protein